MNSNLKFRTWVCGILTFTSLYLLAPTVYSLWNPDAEKLPSGFVDTAMRLGLDLKGGVHMVLGVDLDKVVKNQLSSYGRNLEKALQTENIPFESVVSNEQKGELEIKIKTEEDRKKFVKYITDNWKGTLELLSPIGESEFIRMTSVAEEQVRDRARDQSIQTIRNRIDEFGVAEPIISKKGEDQILVQFPGAKEPERLKSLIGQTAQLNFHIVAGCDEAKSECMAAQKADLSAKIAAAESSGKYTRETFKHFSEYRERVNADLKGKIPADSFIAFEKQNDPNEVNKTKYLPILLSSKEIFSGESIEEARVSMGSDGGSKGFGMERPEVVFRINPSAAKNFEQFTGRFIGHYMAIVLDGVVKSYPVLQSAIGDSGRITLGSAASPDEAMHEGQDLAIVLRAGALPASIEVQEERVIGPSIGRDAIEAGKASLMMSFGVVLLWMILYYGVSGFLAAIVTLVNVALVFAFLGSLHATLTLPGIAGIVLTFAMAVDALVIIFERMREEMRTGKSVNQVIELGFDRAFSAIFDSNVTTIIGAFVLLNFGTGSIRGFALTLIVGIIANVFMATYYAKTLFLVFMRNKSKLSIGLSQKELTELKAGA
jgi:preprotein translocase subunit SecD